MLEDDLVVGVVGVVASGQRFLVGADRLGYPFDLLRVGDGSPVGVYFLGWVEPDRGGVGGNGGYLVVVGRALESFGVGSGLVDYC